MKSGAIALVGQQWWKINSSGLIVAATASSAVTMPLAVESRQMLRPA